MEEKNEAKIEESEISEIEAEEYEKYFEELQKRRLKKIISIIVLVCLMIFFFLHAYLPVSINSIFSEPIVFETPLYQSDVIVVVGAGTDKEGKPLQTERIDRAVELYNQGLADKIIFTGGESKYGYIEAESMKDYALALGVKEEDIILETQALNTFENAQNSFEIIKEKGFEKMILVTTCYHTRRAFKSFQYFQPENLMVTYNYDCWIYKPGIFNRWVGLKEIIREFAANTYYDYKYRQQATGNRQ